MASVVADTRMVPVDEIRPHPDNPNRGDVDAIAESLRVHGQYRAIVVSEATGTILAGNHTYLAAVANGETEVLAHIIPGLDRDAELRILLADNRYAALAELDDAVVGDLLRSLEGSDLGLSGTGYDPAALASIIAAADDTPTAPLAAEFLVPPFSVLDARQGYWTARKRWWRERGMAGEVGRGDESEKAYHLPPEMIGTMSNVSVFDPVLCEVAYRWFAPDGGHILDPFAGGPPRGVVAADLGYRYTGIEIRGEQIAANRANAVQVLGDDPGRLWIMGDSTYLGDDPPTVTADPDAITPVEHRGDHMFKRDDLFGIDGSYGGKVRTALHLMQGADGVTTAGSRMSPQVNIVASIARHLGIPCRVHVPESKQPLTPELEAAAAAGAEIIGHRPGHNSVIIARSRDDAAARGWVDVPFGMETAYAVDATARQVVNLPPDIERIVVPVGSGMTLAGIVTGLDAAGRDTPVLGVTVGADPTKRLDRYAPDGWRDRVTLVPSGVAYDSVPPVTVLSGITLDPIYEAKCIDHVRPGDLLWIVGRRASVPEWQTIIRDEAPYDMIFTCPPYYDLEQYSGGDGDGSMHDTYQDFIDWYRRIIDAQYRLLADNRFAVYVVGDIRDDRGRYRNFISDTIAAHLDAGFHYYNEAILVTPVGTAPVRARSYMVHRKLAKTHQNVLIFYKGDPRTIADHFPPIAETDSWEVMT